MQIASLSTVRERLVLSMSTEKFGERQTGRNRIAAGAASLLGGVAYYLVVRPPGSVWFLPASVSLHAPIPLVVAHLTGFVPTLAHTLGFSLISAGVLSTGRCAGALVCAAWFALESVFELGQRASISSWLIVHQPAWIDRVWLLGNAPRYFARGTFDLVDISSSAAGAAIACFIIHRTQPTGTVS
jgi:hypothetical protein